MALDTTFGNISQAEADRLGAASVSPVSEAIASAVVAKHTPGSTEPWISRLVADFVVARGARTVLETGGFTGATSVYLYDALLRLGGGDLVVCEIDRARQADIEARLLPRSQEVTVQVLGNVLDFLRWTERRFDLAWVDDEHTKPHVTRELTLLMPKMNKGGIILLHDVYGSCDLKTVVQQFGGTSLDLPRLGPAGGLGIIQVS